MNLNIEGLIEDRLLVILSTLNYPVRKWDARREVTLSPVILVKAQPAREEFGTVNTYDASRVTVDIGIVVSKRRNECSSGIANEIRGQVREFIADMGMVDEMNAGTSGLRVYRCGIKPIGGYDNEEKLSYIKTVTVEITAFIEYA